MKNSTLNRSVLSGENMALLAELKAQNEEASEESVKNDASPKTATKQDELDFLWQNFKINTKDEKSPGVYILTGFIAGALSMFLMTAMLSITAFSNPDDTTVKNERKIVKKNHGTFGAFEKSKVAEVKQNTEEIAKTPAVVNDKYKVKAGDSLEAISLKFYGKISPENTEKIRAANALASPHSIYAGQELLIPLN